MEEIENVRGKSVIFAGGKTTEEGDYVIDVLLDGRFNEIPPLDIIKIQNDLESVSLIWNEDSTFQTKENDFDKLYEMEDRTISLGLGNELFFHYDKDVAKYGVRLNIRVDETTKNEKYDIQAVNIGKISKSVSEEEYLRLAKTYMQSSDEDRKRIIEELDKGRDLQQYEKIKKEIEGNCEIAWEKADEQTINECLYRIAVKLRELYSEITLEDYWKIHAWVEELPTEQISEIINLYTESLVAVLFQNNME